MSEVEQPVKVSVLVSLVAGGLEADDGAGLLRPLLRIKLESVDMVKEGIVRVVCR